MSSHDFLFLVELTLAYIICYLYLKVKGKKVITIVFGKPGMGKTAYLTADAVEYMRSSREQHELLRSCRDQVAALNASNPIHVIADLETPEADGLSDAMKKWIVIMIAIILIAVVLFLCPPLLPILVKVVVLPFRLLWWLIKAFGRGISALIQSIKDRKK